MLRRLAFTAFAIHRPRIPTIWPCHIRHIENAKWRVIPGWVSGTCYTASARCVSRNPSHHGAITTGICGTRHVTVVSTRFACVFSILFATAAGWGRGWIAAQFTTAPSFIVFFRWGFLMTPAPTCGFFRWMPAPTCSLTRPALTWSSGCCGFGY